MPRIPLPVKLLISYLGVLLLGAGPTFFYIRVVLQGDLLRESALRMSSQIQKVAETLRSVPESDRLSLLIKFGEVSTHRLTYMSLAGDVLFDSSVVRPLTINHASRSEVKMAMSEPEAKPEGLPVWPGLQGVGYARRHSETTDIETLYVARQMVDAKNQPFGVLRLSTSVDSIEAVTSGTMRFLLNAMAAAASVAILFSLIAAILFVRPLQRVSSMAQSLASGDLGVKVLQPTNDEVGDVARVLNQMATDLRRRLLSAGMSEALLSQLVDALPCACVIFEEKGKLVACNGAGRRALRLTGPEAGARMNEFSEHPKVQSVLKLAENDGQAEPISLDLTDGEPLQGLLHVLKRPGMAPLRVFIGVAVLAQLLIPLTYYLRDDPYDERFAWRMFSGVRLQECEGSVTESHGDWEEAVNPYEVVPAGWVTGLERNRRPVMERYLALRLPCPFLDDQARCGIYAERPSTCRDFSAGSKNCIEARRRVGLEP